MSRNSTPNNLPGGCPDVISGQPPELPEFKKIEEKLEEKSEEKTRDPTSGDLPEVGSLAICQRSGLWRLHNARNILDSLRPNVSCKQNDFSIAFVVLPIWTMTR